MRILGVDPGTVNLGYGIVDSDEQVRLVCSGVLSFSPKIPIEERLRGLYAKLSEIIVEHKPDEVAIEEPFVGRNVRSALSIGRAETVAILAAANQRLPVCYYSPAEVKQSITNYGGSNKEQIQEMVRIHLGLTQPPQPSDAADALAVALCHTQRSSFNQWLADRR
jgi:crossover junction endodeoxyribonuclease RuvC